MAGCSISQTVLRTGQSAYSNQCRHDDPASGCHAFASEHEVSSCAAIPIRFQGTINGILGIYSREQEFFNPAEIKLLDEIALDISYALDRLQEQEQRRVAQRALREREAQLRLFVEHSPAAIAMLDRDMRYLVVSNRWISDYRPTHPELIGRCHYDVFPEVPQRWKDVHQRCLAGAVERCEEDPFPRLDGKTDWVRWEVRPWRHDDGTIGGLIIFSENITATKIAQQHIEHLNRVYAVLSDINQTIVREKDKDAMLRAACRIAVEKGGFRMAWIGMKPKGATCLDISAHAGADQTTLDLLHSAINAGECVFTGRVLQTGNHSICNNLEHDPLGKTARELVRAGKYESLAALPLKDGQNIIGVFTIYAAEKFFFDEEELKLLDELAMDISFALEMYQREQARAKAERDLGLAEDRLLQAQKMEAVGQLAGGVAHDFNNILAALLLQTELSATVAGTPAEVLEGLAEIRTCAERAANLTRQLLLFSRRQIMQSRNLDLNEVITNLMKMLRRIIGEDISLQLNLHPAPLLTYADLGMLEQVLMNLTVNARDAMPQGGRLVVSTSEEVVDLAVTLRHPEALPGRYACLHVSDTGIGIPAEVLPRIFEPFFTTKEPGKGTGLGLSTIFGIVKQHHGWLKVESSPGQGAHFHIYFPSIDPPAATPPVQAPLNVPRRGTETILLVEDDSALRVLTRSALTRFGYHVLEASNGLEALKLADRHDQTIHLLFTDIVMPGGMNGRELATDLLRRFPQMRVVFTSGYSADIAGSELALSPGQDFIQKPAPPFQILEVVRKCLDAHVPG